METETLLTTDACTMPTAERPLRLAEFDALFATAVRRGERRGSDVRMYLTGEEGLVEQVRDLAERETSCCSFLTFALVGPDQDPTLDISVPPARNSGSGSRSRRAGGASGTGQFPCSVARSRR